MRTIDINGRFLAARPTGVQRVARELVVALDRIAAENPATRFRLVHPEGVAPPALRTIETEALRGPLGPLWEQTSLAMRSRGRLLLNLANTAPIAHSRSVVMIHDAQVFESPRSYSPAFRLWYRFLLPRIARRSPLLLTVSAHAARRLSAHGVGRSGEAVVIHNGVDHALRAPADPETVRRLGLDGRPYVLGFASRQAHKNMAFLVEAFADPRLAAVTLALVGDDVPEGAPPNVRRLGRIDDSGLRALYEGAACLAFPSLTEGFGLPPGEAMACGAPAVVADVGAMNDVYAGAARLAPPRDREAWITSIAEIVRDPLLRETLAGRGRERAAQLTWDRAARALHAALESVK